MGINLGALSAAEPRRRKDFAKLMLRAVVAGNIACFMTACVAGGLWSNFILLRFLSRNDNWPPKIKTIIVKIK